MPHKVEVSKYTGKFCFKCGYWVKVNKKFFCVHHESKHHIKETPPNGSCPQFERKEEK